MPEPRYGPWLRSVFELGQTLPETLFSPDYDTPAPGFPVPLNLVMSSVAPALLLPSTCCWPCPQTPAPYCPQGGMGDTKSAGCYIRLQVPEQLDTPRAKVTPLALPVRLPSASAMPGTLASPSRQSWQSRRPGRDSPTALPPAPAPAGGSGTDPRSWDPVPSVGPAAGG